MSTSGQADRFINAFNEIEGQLRRKLHADDGVPFLELVVGYQHRDRPAASQVDALKAFARLRNAIQHSRYYDGKPIAEPVLEIVERVEKLSEQIVHPPTAYAQFRGQRPTVFAHTAAISDVLAAIREFDFSQFPIYDESGRYEGMLTTNCIARWLADRLAVDGLVESQPISTVMTFAEIHETGKFLPRTASAAEAIGRLAPRQDGILPPIALIITETGRHEEKPLAIIVAGDLPTLTAALDVM